MNIYVGNLAYTVRDEELRATFEPFGTVVSAEVIFDKRTRRSRGYGFVEMSQDAEAQRAITALNGKELYGRELRVDASQPKSDKPPMLGANNDRDWFRARRGEYDRVVRDPMVAVIEQLAIDFGRFAPEMVASPKASLYRVYRDTRFSADKTPLKTHVSASFRWRGLPKGEVGSQRHEGKSQCDDEGCFLH